MARQYVMLWSHVVELKRVSDGNTFKINVERPNPTLQSQFGKFTFVLMDVKRGA